MVEKREDVERHGEECRNTCVEKFEKIIEGKRKAALFTHLAIDPDGMGAMMGIEFLLMKKFNLESLSFYDGVISHPQNIAMKNLLDPNLKSIENYNQEDFDLHILVDTIPSYAGVGEHKINFDIVIDHHKDAPNNGFDGLYVNLKAGSASATVYHLIDKFGLKFADEIDYDKRVATGLLVGITTDTENMLGDDATEYEFNAWGSLFPCRDSINLKQIVNFERPKYWVEREAEAVKRVMVSEGVGIVGLGMIPGKHRDMVADIATKMVQWEDVSTAISFAIVDGNRIEGSVRSANASIIVSDLCHALGGKHGTGGGKQGKGAYRYDLGGAGVDEEDDDETRLKTWELFEEKEIKRIKRIIKK